MNLTKGWWKEEKRTLEKGTEDKFYSVEIRDGIKVHKHMYNRDEHVRKNWNFYYLTTIKKS